MEIAEVLRKNGYKVTPQRLAVYKAINHNPTHPNAEAVYKILQPNYPSMSLATVYKTMEIFAKIGVVRYCNVSKMPIVMIIIRRLMPISVVKSATASSISTWTRRGCVRPLSNRAASSSMASVFRSLVFARIAGKNRKSLI